ncbi:MAG: hypothetical protein QOE58_1441 [Actinomycetota bacterium]|nr:hypothetical protein [Actinomycetota bacterium]
MNLHTTPSPGSTGIPSGPRPFRSLVIVMAVGLVIVLIALGVFLLTRDDSKSELAATTPTTATVPTTAAPDPEAAAKAEIIEAYTRSFQAFVAVASDPNGVPEDPRMTAHSTGNAHLAETATIFRLRRDGQVYTGSVEVHATVVELGIGTAIVSDCGIDRTATVDAKTGEVLSPPGTDGHAATAKLRRESGVWKVYEFNDEKRSCAPPVA